jgi:uncharacterized protein
LKEAVPALGRPDLSFTPLSAMRRVEVEGVRIDTRTNKPVVLLAEKQGNRYLLIRVSASEGAAIASLADGAVPGPPFTHDLFGEVLKAVDVKLLTVRIGKSADQAHLCDLGFSDGTGVRASVGDSVAFALRTGAGVFVTAELLDDAGMND